MTTYLGNSCSFCLPRVPFVNCRQFMYLVISLLVLRAGYGIWLYQFLIIAYLFTSDRLPKCEECEKRFHASCSNLGDDELLRTESGDGAWYCTNCKPACGLCSGAVLKGHKAVQCDNCDMWTHNECSFIAETQHETVSSTNYTWICLKCEFFNFSDSFFGEQVNLETENRFIPLTKEKKDRYFPCGTNTSSFISGLKFISMNINNIRGKTKKNWNCWLSLTLISHIL